MMQSQPGWLSSSIGDVGQIPLLIFFCPSRSSCTCFVHTWTPDCLLTQSTQTGRLSLLSTSATPQTNLVSAHTHTQWRNGKETTLNNSTLETQYLLSIVTSSCCFSSCVPFCVNSHRCYQGEPILHPPKQHNSPSLPAHLPGTYLQFTPGDGKNNQCSYLKKIMSLFSGSRKTDWSLILPLPALSQFSKLYL